MNNGNIVNYQQEVGKIDSQMAKLFEERLKLCRLRSEEDMKNGQIVRNDKAEEDYIASNIDLIPDNEIKPYYVRYLRSVMEISDSFQEMLMSGLKVAYGGVEGAYAYIAARNMFPEAHLLSKTDFVEAYRDVENGVCDIAVLPIENSLAGEVGEVMDLIYQGSLYINQIYELPIRHQLLGLKGTSREMIKSVISHPQALSQCSGYVRKNGYETKAAANTSAAAKHLIETNDITTGVIASEETARIFGLEILDSDIQNPGINTTRFAVFSRSLNMGTPGKKHPTDNFILVFTVRNEAGALASTLNIIGAHGYNMRCLRSRPLKSLPWNYYFYMESEGSINTVNGQDMLKELSVLCADVKLVGTYH